MNVVGSAYAGSGATQQLTRPLACLHGGKTGHLEGIPRLSSPVLDAPKGPFSLPGGSDHHERPAKKRAQMKKFERLPPAARPLAAAGLSYGKVCLFATRYMNP